MPISYSPASGKCFCCNPQPFSGDINGEIFYSYVSDTSTLTYEGGTIKIWAVFEDDPSTDIIAHQWTPDEGDIHITQWVGGYPWSGTIDVNETFTYGGVEYHYTSPLGFNHQGTPVNNLHRYAVIAD